MGIADYGSVASLLGNMEAVKKRLEGGLTQNNPNAFGVAAPPPGPPADAPMAPPPSLMAPAPPTSAFPVANPAEAVHNHQQGKRGWLLHLLGADSTSPEITSLVGTDRAKQIQPGVTNSLWNLIAYGKSPQTTIQERAKNIVSLQDAATQRRDAETEREGLAAVRAEMPSPPDGSDYAATLSWNRQFIAKLMGRGLIKQAWQMSQYLDTTPPKDTSPIRLSPGERMYDANGNLIGEAPAKTPEPKYETFDGKRQVSYDNGKTWVSLGKAGAETSDPLVQVQAEDGSAIWVPRSQAAGRKAVTTGSRAESQGRIRREDELRITGDDLTNIDVAIAAVNENPSAFGLKNALPTVVRQRLPDRDNAKDAGTIGSLEFVIGRLRHDRFGGALTPLEASKASRIFSEPTSPPEVIREQLNIIRAAVARKRDHLSSVIGSDGSRAGVPSYEEWKANSGGKP